jgi:hypothetical protein
MALRKKIFKNLPQELMECCKCHIALPLSEFYKNKRYKSGRKTTCIKCYNEDRRLYNIKNPGLKAKHHRLYALRHPDKMRDIQYKTNYGITLNDFNRLYKKQEGKCTICDKYNKKLCVDHNHQTGNVRELLCGSCNKLLGFAKEDINILLGAINYIKRHSIVDVSKETRKTG